MMKKRTLIKTCLTLLIWFVSATAIAQSGLPLSGFVTKVSEAKGTITVGETVYSISRNVRVVNIQGKPAAKLEAGELTVGTYIEFNANRQEPVRKITVVALPKP